MYTNEYNEKNKMKINRKQAKKQNVHINWLVTIKKDDS